MEAIDDRNNRPRNSIFTEIDHLSSRVELSVKYSWRRNAQGSLHILVTCIVLLDRGHCESATSK